jgi:hypothetical protein
MLQAITCNPLIPSFISCSAQALCNPAPPFHPLISFDYLLLNAFVPLSTFGAAGICVFHMEIALWVHVSTLETAVQNLCLPHGACIVGYEGVSSSWWREKQRSGSVKKQVRGWRWGAKGGESITCACLFVPFRQPLCFNYPFLSQGASIAPPSMHHIPHTLHMRKI